uniref:Uncharacterized protein n=1 Tax=Arundo donax TaxID=35708 RepID=A0A0A9EMJ4_ARUDO
MDSLAKLLMFYFAPWWLLMYNLKIYSNLPIMCKLHRIADQVRQNLPDP